MKNVSTAFKRTMEERRDFWCEANITFSDGTAKTLGKEDFTVSGNNVISSAESNSFPLGVVVAKHITLSLVNSDDRWSEYDFYLAKIQVYTKFKLNTGTTESILEGTFTVIEPETYGTVITLTAMDDCYKLDTEYNTSKAFPLTLAEIVRDSCADCGVTLLTTVFNSGAFEVAKQPEGLTHRQVIGLCAMLAGGNAFMDAYNRLSIVSYDFSVFEKHPLLDGGVFDVSNVNQYTSGVDVDGGTFDPWSAGYEYDSGSFADLDDMHVLYQFKSGITIGTDDVVITGIKIVDSDGIEYLSGTTGYVLSLENALAEGKEQAAVTLIGHRLIGLKFRVFSGDHIAYPLADFMDCAYLVDRNNNVYQTVLTDISFNYNGFTTLKCSADSPIRNSSKYNSEATKAEVEARKNTAKQISEYDKAVQMLTSLITLSFGIYKSEEILDDGSSVFYMHNKPTIGESQTIWKMTADAFAVSTDGGQTWNAGMDSSGNAVVNVLSAIGISFNWARGGTLLLGGVDNINGKLKVVGPSGNENSDYTEMDSEGLVHYSSAGKEYYHYMQYTGTVTLTDFTLNSSTGKSYAIIRVTLPSKFEGKDFAITPYIAGIKTKYPTSSGEYKFIYDVLTEIGLEVNYIDTAHAQFTLQANIGAYCLGGTTVSGALVAASATKPESVTIAYTVVA